jgi:hypothetical protein
MQDSSDHDEIVELQGLRIFSYDKWEFSFYAMSEIDGVANSITSLAGKDYTKNYKLVGTLPCGDVVMFANDSAIHILDHDSLEEWISPKTKSEFFKKIRQNPADLHDWLAGLT